MCPRRSGWFVWPFVTLILSLLLHLFFFFYLFHAIPSFPSPPCSPLLSALIMLGINELRWRWEKKWCSLAINVLYRHFLSLAAAWRCGEEQLLPHAKAAPSGNPLPGAPGSFPFRLWYPACRHPSPLMPNEKSGMEEPSALLLSLAFK